METINWLEALGYLASLMVAISLMMKDIVWLRCFNFIGCVLFVIYGIDIAAWPVVGMNGFICLVHIYHLNLIYRRNKTTHPS